MNADVQTTPTERSVKSIVELVLQMSFSVILFCIFFSLSVDSIPVKTQKAAICGYNSCPVVDPNALNVHLIPHSHDDVGWLKTVDQYYFQDVQNVISSVVVALKQNPERKFVQVETAFFKKWWDQQKESVRQDFINLVNNGQIEIINGAWSMNDEAAVHYQSTIDQYTLGLRYLEDKLGKCARPRVGWQIDPFGHSREQASVAAQMGFDSLFFARVDYRDKQNRMNKKTADLLWRGSSNLGNTSDIFTSVLYQHYSAPSGFCFDIVCNDDPIVDDEESPDYNYKKRVEDFANFISTQSQRYATNNLIVTMGDDFRYKAALNAYINTDRLIKGFTLFNQTANGKPIKVMYSTPSCYAKAVNEYVKTTKYQLEIKTDDFFPYADSPNTYWTGYFTSRPASKGFERKGNNLLQVTKQLAATAQLPYDEPRVNSLKEAMGIMQHHDAITGTEKQHVAKNYHLMLTAAMDKAANVSNSILSNLITGQSTSNLELDSCLLANVSVCLQTSANLFTVVVYNPLSRVVTAPITLPIDANRLWTVLGPQGNEVDHVIEASLTDFTYVNLPTSRNTLTFAAKDLPPLGYKVYQLQAAGTTTRLDQVKSASLKTGYDDTNFEIDSTTGLLKSVTMNGVSLEVTQDFLYYSSDNSSGAYIFVPSAKGVLTRINTNSVKTSDISGSVYKGIVQEFSPWAKQTIKVYNDDRDYIEFDWVIGPLNISDNIGKEVITRFTTSLKTKGEFFTDSNGRELLKRTRNSRSDYSYTNEQPVSGNYYPINSKIVIKDDNAEMAVLTDRSQGGSSLQDGEIEIMVHRACQRDDGRGVGENLNEQEFGRGIIVRGKHFLVLGPKTPKNGAKFVAAIQRDVAQRKLLAPWPFITKKDLFKSLKNLEYSTLKVPLPQNVQLLTLEPWEKNSLLIRLEHVLEKGEDSELSKDVTVDLSDLFTNFSISELEETTLSGTQPLKETNRMDWPDSHESKEDSPSLNVIARNKRSASDLKITLAPMQIRTFIAKL